MLNGPTVHNCVEWAGHVAVQVSCLLMVVVRSSRYGDYCGGMMCFFGH